MQWVRPVISVANCMTRDPVTISPYETCDRAIVLMDAAGVDHLPVCERGRVVGILSRPELIERTRRLHGRAERLEPLGSFLPFVQVAGVMTLAPANIASSASLEEAAYLLLSRGLGALAVVDDGALVGILTRRDLQRRDDNLPGEEAWNRPSH